MKKQIIYMVYVTVLLSSRHIYKAYERPDSIDVTGTYCGPASGTDTLAPTNMTNIENLPWKEAFRDPKLQALIEEGLASNIDMQAAAPRVEEAKVLLTSARLSFLPSINFVPQGTIISIGNSEYAEAYSTPLTTSWEVDLFGKLSNTSRGQEASYLQSQYSRQAVRSQLVGGTANTYHTLLIFDRQVEITAKTIDTYKENVRVMEAMKIAGMATEAAVTQMRAAYHQVSGSPIELENQVCNVENSLSVLLAKAPQQIDRGTLEEQVMPEDIMVGVPLQLLESRPDVKIAEMTLVSAYYTMDKARAAFHPGLNTTATVGWTNGSGTFVANPGRFMLQVLTSLAQPTFNNGKLVVSLKVLKAEEKITQMNYQQTILEAGKEVSDALHQYDATSKKLVQDRAQIEQLEKVVIYTSALFQSVQSTYLEILSAQQSLSSA